MVYLLDDSECGDLVGNEKESQKTLLLINYSNQFLNQNGFQGFPPTKIS
jgi:hypothetical protein